MRVFTLVKAVCKIPVVHVVPVTSNLIAFVASDTSTIVVVESESALFVSVVVSVSKYDLSVVLTFAQDTQLSTPLTTIPNLLASAGVVVSPELSIALATLVGQLNCAKTSEVVPKVIGSFVVSAQAVSPFAVPSVTKVNIPLVTSALTSASVALAHAPDAAT
jgi:hypothetical protein